MTRAHPPVNLPLRRDRPLVLAHRGASADAPENTLAAFREAVRQGADGVELDLRCCGSGELVGCPDPWLDRVAGIHLEVESTPLARLKELDVGVRFSPAFAGERIPTVAEVWALRGRDVLVNVELKSERPLDRKAARRAAREIVREEAGHPFLITSFNPLNVAEVRFRAPSIAAGVLAAPTQNLHARESFGRVFGASAMVVQHGLATRENVQRWHREGMAVVVWTVDEPVDVERCCEAGVDALVTNSPGATLALVRRCGARA